MGQSPKFDALPMLSAYTLGMETNSTHLQEGLFASLAILCWVEGNEGGPG